MQAITTTVKHAASLIGVSRCSIYRLINEGKVASAKVRGRRLIKVDSLHALVDQAT
ncbi:helix-turn-helix domain-containing protein [Sphingomonas sp.]|uniref:helix-turn-helix domain-containing protein n=1 Tax=Sphingomonas sp. TaxID=28214 RepID=UPI003AFFFF34